MGGADVGGIVGVPDSSSSSLGGVLRDAVPSEAVGQPEPKGAPAGEGVGRGVRRDGGRDKGKTERK